MTQNLKTVLIIGSYAPSLVQFRGPLIASIVALGHKVIAAAPDISADTAAALQRLGAEPVDLPIVNVSLNPFATLRSLNKTRLLIKKCSPDVVISYTIKPVILGAIMGRALGVRRIVSLITGLGFAFTDGREAKRVLARAAASFLYKRALSKSDEIIFQNPDDAALFRELGLIPKGREPRVINGSGVDLDHFKLAPLPTAPSFLMIARLRKDKGVREYAAAAKRLKQLHPDLPIALVGYVDPSPNSLSPAEISELAESGVDFRGRMEDVRPALMQACVYVLPSYREGTPRSVLEAMAMGRAIITTDAPGCRQTVSNGQSGILVPVRDPDALFLAMLRFVQEPSLAPAMGAAARKLAEERFDVHAVNAKILEYADLV
jgi:glycosyltransferase involved in cell wall biosynthesis